MNTRLEKELSGYTSSKPAIVSIGIFDGVHIGHQRLIERLVAEARTRSASSVVVTFWPHPLAIVLPKMAPPHVDELDDRVARLKSLGVDMVVVLTFTREVAALGAAKFVNLLREKFKMKGLIIGPDFALGKEREGSVYRLRELGQQSDFTVEVIPPVVLNGKVVSSTAIRQALAEGNVREASAMLGRPFKMSCEVVSGDGRGRELGFPTANLAYAEQALPGNGVYATIADIAERTWPSVTNVGVRPTFDGGRRLVEVHIIGFSGDLYGKTVTVEFIERIRDEKRFGSVAELKKQMTKDVARAMAILKKYSSTDKGRTNGYTV